jgi:hypothetical protein
MTTPIGTAVSVPATPTSGATAAPVMNWITPSSADAAPATSGWGDRASAVALGSAKANEQTITNSGTITAHAPRPPATTTARSTSVAQAVVSIARRSSTSGSTRPARRALSRLDRMSPKPPAPKTTL